MHASVASAAAKIGTSWSKYTLYTSLASLTFTWKI